MTKTMSKSRAKSRADDEKSPHDHLRRPRDRRHWFVISYDIPDNKRRTKVMKLLEGYGHRAQFSVFECDLGTKNADTVRQRLEALIDAARDDVRIYYFCDGCLPKTRMLGKAKRHKVEPSVII